MIPWEPDPVLPSQLWKARASMTPEQTLLLAVLEQALRDLATVARIDPPPTIARQRGSLRRDVIAWFRSDDASRITDFVAICEVFGLDPQAVRRALGGFDWQPASRPTHGVRVTQPGRATRMVPRRLRA